MFYDSHSQTEEDLLVEELTSNGEHAQLIVLNDDYNTFDWVIECLMELLHHTSEQAERLVKVPLFG